MATVSEVTTLPAELKETLEDIVPHEKSHDVEGSDSAKFGSIAEGEVREIRASISSVFC